MKVLIVNTSERKGGAAVAASRLCDALNNNGVKAKMLVRDKQSDDVTVVGLSHRWLRLRHFLWERLVIFCHQHFQYKKVFKIDIANSGTDITRLKEFREADIIHLHWVNQGMLSLKGLKKILQSGKPVVWTLHDMWPLTAICHHAYECDHYKQACGNCFFLRQPSAADLSSRVFKKKKRMLDLLPQTAEAGGRLHLVAVSQWLAERTRQSALTGRFPVSVIPNVLSLQQFTIIDRMDARSALQVDARYVIAFGAARIDDPIKGFGHLAEALGLLVSSGRYAASDFRLLLFGHIRDASVLGAIPVPYTHLGYVDDVYELSEVYSAANVTVSSSLYETFGQTLIEAMACGCVPVSFDGSGQADIITHGKNGYLARRLSAESLANGMEWGLKKSESEGAALRKDLRRSVVRRYGESVVANQYMNLYQSLIPQK